MTGALKRLVNRAAVREAFHSQGARVPRGFLEDVEQTVYVLLRRAAAGEIEPRPDVELDVKDLNLEQLPLKRETLDRVEAGLKKFFGHGGYLKQSVLKEALREALGKHRVETAWVAHLNAVVSRKVSEASFRSGARAGSAPRGTGVPGCVIRTFLRSAESRTMTLSGFFRRWQDAGFREEWTARAETIDKRRSR